MNARKKPNKGRFATRAIHSGHRPDSETGAVVPPIQLATTYTYDGINQPKEFAYTRYANPTRAALEKSLASLEEAELAFCFASGIAAGDSILRLLQPNDHVVLGGLVYGGMFKLLKKVYGPKMGIQFSVADLSDPKGIEKAMLAETRILWMESPTNPMLEVVDLKKAAVLAKEAGCVSVVDNTFATPYLQRPLESGIDVVMHSSTKYLGGHSDVLGGVVLTNSSQLGEYIQTIQRAAGAVPGPFDCYTVFRGVKTLALRVERHSQNAMAVAEMLEAHPNVLKVNYPGLASHPMHKVAASQMKAFGGMLSFHIKGGKAAAEKFFSSLELLIFAESLGAVESIISYPPTMSHGILDGTEWEMPDDLIRVSVGLEDIKDLLEDLSQALDSL